MDLLKRSCSGSNLCRFTKIFQRACFSVLAYKGWVRNTSLSGHNVSGSTTGTTLGYRHWALTDQARQCHAGIINTELKKIKVSTTLPTAVVHRLNCLLEDIRKAVTAEEDASQLNAMTNYSFLEGGKLLRPVVVLLTAGATHVASHASGSTTCKCATEEDILDSQYKISLISEMIHTASLIHDDIIDESNERRGRPTLHQIGGNKLAVLVGDYILAKATQLLSSIGNAEVIKLLSQVIEDLVKGEFMQMGSRDSEEERFAHYMTKTFKKTASLFAHSCKAVSVLAGCPASITDAAFQYGRHLGIAFQLIDDALDFVSRASVLGKPAAADLRLGIATAPVLFAARQHPLLSDLILRRFSQPGDVQLAWELVLNSDGIIQTKKLAEMHGQEALRHAELFPDSEYKRELLTIASVQASREK